MGRKIRINETVLKNIIKESVLSVLNESERDEPNWNGRMKQAGAGLNVAKKKMDAVYGNKESSVSDRFKSLTGYDESLKELVRAIKDFAGKGGTEEEIQDIISDTLKDSYPRAKYSNGVFEWDPSDR